MEQHDSPHRATATPTQDSVSQDYVSDNPQQHASDIPEANRSDSCFPGSNQTHASSSRQAKRRTARLLQKNKKPGTPQLTWADKYKKLEELYHGSFIMLSRKQLRDLTTRWTDDHAFQQILAERDAIIQYSIDELISEARAGAEARESGQNSTLDSEEGQHQEAVSGKAQAAELGSDRTQIPQLESGQARVGQEMSEHAEEGHFSSEQTEVGSDMSGEDPVQAEVASSKVEIRDNASYGSASMEISDHEQGS